MRLATYRGWFLAAGVGVAVALLLAWSGAPRTTQAAPGQNDISVDVDPGTAGIQTSIAKPIGVPFNVDIVVQQDTGGSAAGYQFKMSAKRQVLNITAGAAYGIFCTGASICAPAGPVIQNVGGVQDPGGAPLFDRATIFAGETVVAGPASSNSGSVYHVTMVCLAPGKSALDLRPLPDDGLGQVTQMLGSASPDVNHDAGSIDDTGVNPDTAGITCELQADLRVNKVGPATIALGTDGVDVTSTIIAYNDGPNPAYSVWVTETFDPPATYVADTDPYMACTDVSALVIPPRPYTYLCPVTSPINPMDTFLPGTSKIFTFTVHLPLELAGKIVTNGVAIQSFNPLTQAAITKDVNQQPQPTLGAADFYNCLGGPLYPPTVGPTSRLHAGVNYADPLPEMAGPECDNVTVVQTQVLPALVSVSKVAETVPGVVNGTEVWDVNVSNAAGGSAASVVSVKDTVDSNEQITGAAGTDWVCGAPTAGPANNVTCNLTGVIAAGASAPVLKVTANVVAAAGTKCQNDAAVTFADPTTVFTGTAAGIDAQDPSVVCVTPDVKMMKDPAIHNLWLCQGTGCDVDNGEGSILIDELVYNVAMDPDGVGAFEFVARFDHKVLDVTIARTSWLAANGRLVICTPTIIDENAIHFACVSKDPDWQSDPGTPPPGATTVGIDPATAAILTVKPTVDMVNRLTPGQDNGVVTTIVDDNCELADIYGDPLSSGVDPVTHQPILLPGVLPGGGIAICTNSTLTVRILEGDLNVDCKVDVTDDQAIAYRYGASFGSLLYSPWYDLEPALKDNDIDIKDLQKVFGRNGSTCAAPIPSYQTPQAPPP